MSATGNCCSDGFDRFIDWVIPLGLLRKAECVQKFYKDYPLASRVIAAPVGLLNGSLGLFIFPLLCLVGVVAMPIIAVVRATLGYKDGGDWLKAWCFSVIGVAASIGFLAVFTYYLPLVSSSALLISLIAASIVIHVYRFSKEPTDAPRLEDALTASIVSKHTPTTSSVEIEE